MKGQEGKQVKGMKEYSGEMVLGKTGERTLR